MILKYTVAQTNSGKTVKSILKHEMELSERLIKKLKYDQKIKCNSTQVFINYTVTTGDVVEVNIEFDEECDEVIPEDMDIDIIYEDDYFLAINKSPNIVVHPTSYHPSGTIANAVMHHFLQQGLCRKIRPVSRLDRDTSGIIIFAKNQFVQEHLIRQMKSKSFSKEYIGVVNGKLDNQYGTIDLPIARQPDSIMLRHVSTSGVRAVTHYEVLEYMNNATLLKFKLETGRTHQIRVHCQALGHPLIGDTLYSDIPTELISRQALHSHVTRFIHPYSKECIVLSAPVPNDINNLLLRLK